jgi:hypothetical protein
MIGVKLGCNGVPRRRIMSAVGSNGLMKVLSMEEGEDEYEEDQEEDDQ